MKRFVIGTNRTTAEQDAAFVNILKARWPHLGWWHQLGETWLIIDYSDQLTPVELRDTANQAFPGIRKMVIEIGGSWAGFAPVDDFTWMNEQWDRPG